MFLRPNNRTKDGKAHAYWSLVETVRTPDGPRQRTLCYLGELNGSAQARWLKTIEVFNEQGESRQLKLFPAEVEPPEDDPNVARVVLNKVRLERSRQFGNCYVGLDLWKRLELDQFYEDLIDERQADVPWSRIAALLVNEDGFPLSYETFDGNRADVTTLETVIRMVERKYGKARRVWIFDRGIISEDNLQALRKRGGQYLVGTPRAKLKQFEKQLLDGEWKKIRPDVEVQRVATPAGDETYILCRSTARKAKETAMRHRVSTSMEKALGQLEKRIASGKLKDRSKIERMLGKIQARHPSVHDLYKVAVQENSDGLRLEWKLT